MPAHKGKPKNVWSWVETADSVTQAHVNTVYRLPPSDRICTPGSCRKNCMCNPFCLNAIGETPWLRERDGDWWNIGVEDPNDEGRVDNQFVGLKNLGATCYVNSIIQVLFHNQAVRRAVYQWRDCNASEASDWSPTSDIAHLQCLFALLEKTRRKYIDPTPLISCLGINAVEQQDAQEFAKLFLDLMMRRQVSPVLQQQFCGSYVYVTSCETCKSESRRSADFSELQLNIQGHSTLGATIKGFLKEERLDGENKYDCSVCGGLREAVRHILLDRLPVVLNLQLMRFVYDTKTMCKKKLNSAICFPDSITLSDYTDSPGAAGHVYDITAVLIHRGPSAYSGHYVAHIRDEGSKAWYRYNDEVTERMAGKRLQLGAEEDIEENGALTKATTNGRIRNINKLGHSTKNAYMLVYTERAELEKYWVNRAGDAKDGAVKAKQDNAKAPKVDNRDVKRDRSDVVLVNRDVCDVANGNGVETGNKMNKVAGGSRGSEARGYDSMMNCSVSLSMLDGYNRDVSSDKPESESITGRSSSEAGDCTERGSLSSSLSSFDEIKNGCRKSDGTRSVGDTDRACEGTDENSDQQDVVKMMDRVRSGKLVRNVVSEESGSRETRTRRSEGKLNHGSYGDRCVGSKENRKRKSGDMQSPGTCGVECVGLKENRKRKSDEMQNAGTCATDDGCDIETADDGGRVSRDVTCTDMADSLLPSNVLNYVEGDNKKFEEWVAELTTIRNINIEKGMRLQERMRATYQQMWTTADQDYEWVSLDWLSLWMKDPVNAKEIDNTRLLCSHDRLNYEKIHKVKAISTSAAERFFEKYKGGPRLPKDSLCAECVRQRHERMRLKKRVDEDERHMRSLRNSLDDTDQTMTYYWAGKVTLRKWRSMVLDRLGQTPDTEETDEELVSSEDATSQESTNPTSCEVSLRPNAAVVDAAGSQEARPGTPENDEVRFNDDILCEHGNLNPKDDCRKLVAEPIWAILRSYFPSSPQYVSTTPTCDQCTVDEDVESSLRLLAKSQRKSLEHLYLNKNRPSWIPRDTTTLYLVTAEFVDQWRAFVRDAVHNEPITDVVNSHMTCEHGGLIYDLQDLVDSESSVSDRFVYLRPSEWQQVQKTFTIDHPVSILRVAHSLVDGQHSEIVHTYDIHPDVCTKCVRRRRELEMRAMYTYKNATVYIRQLSTLSHDSTRDQDYMETTSKRKKSTEPSETVTKHPRLSDEASCRRSSRHRRVRGEKQVTVSSDETLMMLKVKIMSLFDVMPSDQDLSIDGEALTPPTSTLADLKVAPQSVICLKVDEYPDSQGLEESIHAASCSGIETGFLGTSLVS